MIKIMIMIRQGLLLWHDNDDDWIGGLLFVVCPAHVVPRRSVAHAINVTLTIINLVIIINAIIIHHHHRHPYFHLCGHHAMMTMGYGQNLERRCGKT